MQILRDSPNEKMIFNENNDPTKLDDIVGPDIYQINEDDLKISYPNNFHKLVYEQYFYKDTYITYKGKYDHYDYNNSVTPPSYYKTGYDNDVISDYDGTFYIVHQMFTRVGYFDCLHLEVTVLTY